VQGIAVGGEVAGAVILTMEWAGPRRRGLFASLPALGIPLALILATAALRLTTGPDRPDWAWRIPFLLSALLLVAALVIRRAVPETPGFAGVRRDGELSRRPVRQVLRAHPRALVTSALVRTAEQAPQTLFTTFVLSYGTVALHLPRTRLLDFTLIAGQISLLTIPQFGHLSDRWGRRRVTAAGIVALALYAFPYFALLNRATEASVLIAIVLSLVIHDIMFGPQPALIAERFPTGLRYSGAGLSSQSASVFAGGPAPLIAAAIFAATGSSTGIAWYLIGTAVVSMAALLAMPPPAGETEASGTAAGPRQ
jgi:MFS family permease